MVPSFIFVVFGIQSRQNTLLLNILFENGDLVPNFGPTIEVLSNFMKFPGLWANFILKLKYVLFIRLEIEIAVKSRGTVRK